jgi:hypothetical protein
MPVSTPDIKVANVRKLGGHVELVGESYQEAQVSRERGRHRWAATWRQPVMPVRGIKEYKGNIRQRVQVLMGNGKGL